MKGLLIDSSLILREGAKNISFVYQNLQYALLLETAIGVTNTQALRDQWAEISLGLNPDENQAVYDYFYDLDNQALMDNLLVLFEAWRDVWDAQVGDPEYALYELLVELFPWLITNFNYQLTTIVEVEADGN